MQNTFRVLDVRKETYTGKRGQVEMEILNLLDLSDTPMLNTLDYILTAEEKSMSDKPEKGQQITIGISDITVAFGGRLRLRGKILIA